MTASHRTAYIFLSVLGCLIAITAAAGCNTPGADPVAGTYLVTEGSGTKSLWTFTADGLFLGTSSTQPSLSYSNQQGSWEARDDQTIQGVMLDFSFDEQGALANTARVDFSLACSDSACGKISGDFTLRFFEDGEDPLDPSTGSGETVTDTFTGLRVTPQEQ